ncbi:MAG: DHH family phosphoesterase [Candidatus Paraimprobicoccus trichonymphae]|uniref:DHH family phosphoesterase n=1 Tax=Candidatus Paraimprobicoccus trichonymphae TaxID=3033793 RepID=A0AA48ICJ9_9FIRM|nr:MAG: DHH family phosphoesterase [Candidatus Paraimprobicoccus trichonymphae]
MKKLNELADILKTKDNICILTHIYPDGDTLGSAFALCRAFQKIGKKSKVLCSDNTQKKYENLKFFIENQDFKIEYIISVDIADLSLLGENLAEYSDKININIDHHISNKRFAEINYVNFKSAATAEIIYDLLLELEIEIDIKIAECLYIGISTDTGCFKYPNTSSRSHRITAELINTGIDISKINHNLFEIKSKKIIKIENIIYKNLEYFCDEKCAFIYITQKMLKDLNIKNDNELEGLASIPKQIEGVEIGITIREKPDNLYKISVRTNNNVNAVKICEIFGGGGHPNASGCFIKGNLEYVKIQLLKSISCIL